MKQFSILIILLSAFLFIIPNFPQNQVLAACSDWNNNCTNCVTDGQSCEFVVYQNETTACVQTFFGQCFANVIRYAFTTSQCSVGVNCTLPTSTPAPTPTTVPTATPTKTPAPTPTSGPTPTPGGATLAPTPTPTGAPTSTPVPTTAAALKVTDIQLSNVIDVGAGNVCVAQGQKFYLRTYISDADGFADIQWLNFSINGKVGNAGRVAQGTPANQPVYYEGRNQSGAWVPDPVSEDYKCASPDGNPYFNSCTDKAICINNDGSVTLSGITFDGNFGTACPNGLYAFNLNAYQKDTTNQIWAEWGFKPLAPLNTRPGIWARDFASNQTDGDTTNTTAGDWVWDDKWLVYPCDSTPPTSTITSPAAGSWPWLGGSGTPQFVVGVNDVDNTGGSGLKSCEYHVLSNGIETKPWSNRECSSLATIPISVGTSADCRDEGTNKCTVEVKSTDKHNNVSAIASRSFNMDYTPPSLSFTRSPTTPTSADTVTFTAIASDVLSGLSTSGFGSAIYIDPTPSVGIVPIFPVKTCTTFPCTYSNTFTVGTHINYAYVSDLASNSTRSPKEQDTFIVADVSGTITNTSTTDNTLTVNMPSIAAGSAALVSLSSTDATEISVNKTAVAVKNAVTNPQIVIDKSTTKPSGAPTAAAGTIYQYLTFTTQNMTAADIKATAIEFQVAKSWISANSVDPTKIVLSRYDGTKWNELGTAKISEDTNNVYFSAQSPGYSVFAITTQAPAATPTPTPTPTSAATPTPTPTTAPTFSCGSGTTRATGLVSTPDFTSGSKFGTSGGCVINPRAAFLELPTYDRLKSSYYTQKKQTSSTVTKHPLQGDKGEEHIPFDGTLDHLYHINGNLTIDCTSPPCNVTGPNSGVVLVEGALNINEDYTSGTNLTGTVFVVKGNVNIAQSVTQIDAVIIAEGKIYTAGASCSQATPVLASQLIINGSFISLAEGNKIEFCRTLSDNSQPAEKVNHKVKYLVILRDLLSDTVQKWSEIP